MSAKPIIIIGSGVFGLSSALHLASAGYTNITVLDRGEYDSNEFNPLKGAYGASTDISKLIRALYVDKTHYQNLAIESLRKYYEWNKQLLTERSRLPPALQRLREECLGSRNEQPLFFNSGYVRLDDYQNNEEERNLKNFESIGLRILSYDANNPDDVNRSKLTGWYSKLDPLQQKEKVPEWSSVLDSFAGVVHADKCLLWVRHLCEQTGHVKFIYGSLKGNVKDIVRVNGETTGVQTKDGSFHVADYVVVATGGWTNNLLKGDVNSRLECQGSSYIIIEIPESRPDLITKYSNFPMINWRMTYELNFREDAIYMFPATKSGLLKIGLNDHFWRYYTSDGCTSEPKTDRKTLPTQSLKYYDQFVNEWLPDIASLGAKITFQKLCFSAVGQNNELLIDRIPHTKNLIIASGGGFHGYKFLPVIGRFVEGIISGETYEYHEHFKFDNIKREDYKRFIAQPHHILNTAE